VLAPTSQLAPPDTYFVFWSRVPLPQVAANGAGRGMELGEKLLARRQACAEGGAIFVATAKVEAHYDRHSPVGSPHLTGSLSMADVAVFCYFGHGVCGFFDGVDPEYLNAFPRIRAARRAVVEIPAVQKYYEAEAEKQHMKLSMGGLDVGEMYRAIVLTARSV
jgi:glutathione S-transferase